MVMAIFARYLISSFNSDPDVIQAGMLFILPLVLYQFLDLLLKQFLPRGWWRIGVCLVVTMMLYVLIIPFMRRFMPHVTAQKDVIKIN